MYVRLVKCEPAKEAGDFSNQPAFFQICRLKAGSRLSWKALIMNHVSATSQLFVNTKFRSHRFKDSLRNCLHFLPTKII